MLPRGHFVARIDASKCVCGHGSTPDSAGGTLPGLGAGNRVGEWKGLGRER